MADPSRWRSILMWLALITLLALAMLLGSAWAQEGCQGFGQTVGGTGQPVVQVTTLSDSGPGSLRSALSGSNRRVVFEVAGTIRLASDLTIRGSFITIDGLSAPAPGITLQGRGLILRGARDVIVRGLRSRNAQPKDALWITDGSRRVSIEHVSLQGAMDGNLDITRAGTQDISVCDSIIAQPAGEEKNMLLEGTTHLSVYRNLFIAARQRNPQCTWDQYSPYTSDTTTTLDLRYNLIWNWRGGYGTRIRWGCVANVVGNYYGQADDALIVCKGPGAPSECDNQTVNRARVFVQGNYNASNALSTDAAPFGAPALPVQTALESACAVMRDAGVRPLDAVDAGYLSQIHLSGCALDQLPPQPPVLRAAKGGG